jgi:electron transport complex protein RnfG
MINRHPVVIAAVLLGMFAVIGTTLVSFTYENTRERIAENERQALLKKLYQLIPADDIDNDIVNDTIMVSNQELLGSRQSIVYRGRKLNQPVAAVFYSVAPEGYSGGINMLVAVKTDGTLGGVRIVSHRETPGLGDKIEERKSDWILGFEGKSLTNPEESRWKVKRDGGDFDQFTGATITPRVVVHAIKKTLLFFQQNKEAVFKQESEK